MRLFQKTPIKKQIQNKNNWNKENNLSLLHFFMKFNRLFLLMVFCCTIQNTKAHEAIPIKNQKYKNKGKIYFYWGWNNSTYSRSDIHFKGNNYSFRLDDVKAKDRPSGISWTYLTPSVMTIPQYNYRIGYFFKENWNISIGTDHMKYVVLNGQITKITGHIDIPNSPFNGDYDKKDQSIVKNFLQFEHTDGLNYGNIELRHHTTLKQWEHIGVQAIEGIGIGLLIPRTNSTLLGKERNDEFHLSGYGIATVFGLHLDYNGGFFIQPEIKGGFINMPNIRTTKSKDDIASQNFFFLQYNIVFGYKFQLVKQTKKSKTKLK